MILYLTYVFSPLWIYLILRFITNDAVNENEKLKKIYMVFCGIVMALAIGLRHPLTGSSDTSQYFLNWQMMSNITIDELPSVLEEIDLEKGYLIYVWLFSHVFPGGQYALFISGLIYTISVCVFVKRNCENVVLALLMFNSLGLFSFMVQGMRQAIAMSICLWTLEFCIQKKPIKFVLTVALAGLFHGSAWVFLIMYPLSWLKLNLKGFFIFSIYAVIIAAMFPTLLNIMNTILNDNYTMGEGAETGGVVAVLTYVIIILAGILFQDREREYYPMFVYMTIIGMIAMIMRNTSSTIMERISLYFAFGQMAVLPTAIKKSGDKKMQIFINILAGALCIGVALHKTSYSVLIPYNFFWEQFTR